MLLLNFKLILMGKKIKTTLLLLASGLILNFANTNLWILLISVSLVPLFIFLNSKTKKKAPGIGFLFGFGIGTGMFFWMIQGVSHYTGNGFFYGFLTCVFSSFFVGFYFTVISWITKIIWDTNAKSNWTFLLNRLCVAAIWTVLESGLAFLLESFPLHYFRIGFPFVTNIYSIQLASLGGLALLTFLTVLINLLLQNHLFKKRKGIY